MPKKIVPDDVRRSIEDLTQHGVTPLIIFDEFDRLSDKHIAVLMSDTIKALSDLGISGSILIIGVASSVDELIKSHQSIERALVQIQMPRMSPSEIKEIINKGLGRLGMTIDADALSQMSSLSQGLPYITHMLGLHCTRETLSGRSVNVTIDKVDKGIQNALDQWQQSIISAYYNATKSAQPGNIYKEVLLACALAEIDDLGYFAAASVRTPLRTITGKTYYDVPNFARHLKEFSVPLRGEVLERVGTTRRLRYRFVGPLMRPYIVMRGFAEGLIDRKTMREIENA